MKSFELIEHVADVRLKLAADSLQELFLAGLHGMAELIKEDSTKSPVQKSPLLKIDLKASDSTSLLIDFLAQVLARTHVNNMVYTAVSFIKLTETEITAVLTGLKVTNFDEDVKAVTYHEAEVIKDGRGIYQTMVIFDI